MRLAVVVHAVADRHPAAADCERVRAAFVAQPANTWSSAAYLAAGAVLLAAARRRRWPAGPARVLAAVVAANGFGGLAFHGPGTPLARWLHDVALVATFAAVAACDAALVRGRPLGATARPAGVAVLAGAVVLALAPAAVGVLTGVGVVAVVAGEAAVVLSRRHRPVGPLLVAAAAIAGAGLLNGLARTDGPWCRPDGWLQGHAAWHLLTAAAIGGWAWATLDTGRDPRPDAPPLAPPAPTASGATRPGGYASSSSSSSTGVTTPE